MEPIKCRCITSIFLLLFLLTLPYIIRGKSEVQDSEINEIDYRGPETHSSIFPPPGHYHGRPLIHHKSTKTYPKSKGLNDGNPKNKAEKLHG